ncbi:MAG: hypothetical protein COA79_08630 [Planctomycetota bacterium]|nr:MAG: hypothetical protein COA79_08630 [Planctomycetota bacterium]
MLQNYFKILEIQQTTDLKIIKNAYKKLATQYHPDKNKENQDWAEDKFKLVSETYRLLLKELEQPSEILSEIFYNPNQQEERESAIPNYWDTIRNSEKPEDKIKLILRDLETENQEEAIKCFKSLEEEMKGINPLSLLSPKDYFDASYLIAEVYEAFGEFQNAVKYFTIYYRHIRTDLHRLSFSKELKENIINLYRNNICQDKKSPQSAEDYKRLIRDIPFSKKEMVLQLEFLIKLYIKQNNFSDAKESLEQAFEYDEKSSKLIKLKEKIISMEKK